jgi:hypothetical protein
MATGSMLVRLTRAKRLWAVRFAVLIYALCILAPTLSFALPGSQAVSPCLTDANHMLGMVHVHAEAPAAHRHANGTMHDHAAAHSHAGPSHDTAAIKAAMSPEQTPAKGHASDAQCCGLMCLTALPATLVEIVTPCMPTAAQAIETYLEVADNGPALLYRPPIA